MSESSWWRRNRWALAALPFALVLALAGNASRVDSSWWARDLHAPTVGVQGEFVRFHQEYVDAVGTDSRTLEVRLDSTEDLTEIPREYSDPIEIPDGFRGVRVDLSFKADPDQSVYACQLALRGANGDRYVFDPDMVGVAQVELAPCHTFGQPGPKPALFKGGTRGVIEGEERPPEWEMHPVVLVPEGAEVTDVLIWWEMPDHLRLKIRD